MLNLAIVGLGWWGRTHVDAVHGRSEKVQIVHLVEPDTARAGAFAAGRELPLSADYAAALADPAVDAVVLVTPHSLHTSQILAAAAAGKHAFTEKPFALSMADARRTVAAAHAAGIQLGLGHNQRFAAPQAEIKRLIAAGELGQLLHIEGNTSHDTLTDPASWRHDPAEAPGGGLWHMGSHYVDLFNHYAGAATEVYAQALDNVQARDTAAALLKYACGASGYIGNMMTTAPSCHLQVFGSAGWARVASPTELVVARRGGAPETIAFEAADPVRANIENFADAIAGRAAYRIAPEEMVHDVAVLDAMARALATGQPQRIDAGTHTPIRQQAGGTS